MLFCWNIENEAQFFPNNAFDQKNNIKHKAPGIYNIQIYMYKDMSSFHVKFWTDTQTHRLRQTIDTRA